MKKLLYLLLVLPFLLGAGPISGGPIGPGTPGQALDPGASPTFVTETLTGLTASKPVFTDAGKVLTSSGTVPVDQGGTGATTLDDGGIVIGNGTGAVEVVAPGLTTQVLVGGGVATKPAWGTDIPTGVTIGSAYIYRAGGTDIPFTDGGTGISAWTQYLIPYAATTTSIGQIAIGTAGQPLLSAGAGAAPAFGNDLATATTVGSAYIYRASGTDVPVTDGGTGVSTLADGGLVVGNGTNAVEVVAPGATTTILVGGGAATNPIWTTATGTGAPVRAGSPTFTTQITTPAIIAPAASLVLKPSQDGIAAIQLSDLDGNAILNIDTTNNWVGIGTVAPATILDIRAPVAKTVTDRKDIYFFSNESLASNPAGLRLSITGGANQGVRESHLQTTEYGTANSGFIDLQPYGGSVGIGVTAPTAQLHTSSTVRFANFGAGAATFDATGNVSSVSDERMKDVRSLFTLGLAEVQGINPILYKYKSESGLDVVNTYAGFSAQNIMQYIPEAVGKGPDDYYSLQDRAILAVAINAIKELKIEIDELKTELKMVKKYGKAKPVNGEGRIVISPKSKPPKEK